MGGFLSAPRAAPPPPPPPPPPAPEPEPQQSNSAARTAAGSARARRLGRPLLSGSPLGVTQNQQTGLATTLGPGRPR